MAADYFSNHTQQKSSVNLTGSALEGGVGPPIGLLDIGVSEDAYIFRVALPGIRKNESKLRCEIQRDGTVRIHGVATNSGGIMKDSTLTFQMKVQQLCPPGSFTINFKLPGPVDPRLFTPLFRTDGILEVVVMKSQAPRDPLNA